MGGVRKGLVVFIVVLVVLAGCVPTGQTFSPIKDLSTDQAAIYLYRPYNMVGGGKMYTAFVDDEVVGKLVNGAYLPLLVSPGTHKVVVKQDSMLIKGEDYEATVKVVASEISYLRFGGMWTAGQAQLIDVDEVTAMPELEKCKKY